MNGELGAYEELLTRWIKARDEFKCNGLEEPQMPGEPGSTLRMMAELTRTRTFREMGRMTA